MTHTRKYLNLIAAFAGTALLLAPLATTGANENNRPAPVSWRYHQNTDADNLRQSWQQSKEAGYLPIDIEADSASRQYLSIWQENITGKGWISWHGLSGREYERNVERYRQLGYSITDQDLTAHDDQPVYSLVMRQNKPRRHWLSYNGLQADSLKSVIEEHSEQYQPVDLDAVFLNGETRYSLVMQQSDNTRAWRVDNHLSQDTWLQQLNEYKATGYEPVNITCYRNQSELQYSAIGRESSRSWVALHGMTATDMRNRLRQFADQGMRLSDVALCPVDNSNNESNQALYAAVWIDNEERYAWPGREASEQLLSDYAAAIDVPGVSAAIVKNGRVLFRGGTGFADKANKIQSHSGTVYRLASISKAIVGTIAFNLAQDDLIDLDTPTRNYLGNLAPAHQHTIRQLLKNTGCVKSYEDDSYDDNNTRVQYESSSEALKHHLGGALGSDDWIIKDCNPGDHHYSTHGYTHVTAALEAATGKSFDTLVKQIIVDPLQLNSIKVENRSSAFAQGEKAELTYKANRINEAQFQNVSWKAGGSGMESSALDLALFGDAVAGNRYFSREVKTQMWSGGENDSELHGWSRVSSRGEIEKGGVNQGTDVHIRIDPATGITVVAMTNTVVPATRTPVLTEKLMDLAKKQLQSTLDTHLQGSDPSHQDVALNR